MRSEVGSISGSTFQDPTSAIGAASELVALAYHPNYVRKAISGTWAFLNENDALHFGDVLSFGTNAGASISRSDTAGCVIIKETTV